MSRRTRARERDTEAKRAAATQLNLLGAAVRRDLARGRRSHDALSTAASAPAMAAVATAKARRVARRGQVVAFGTSAVIVVGADDWRAAIEVVRSSLADAQPGLVALADDEFAVRDAWPDELADDTLPRLVVEQAVA